MSAAANSGSNGWGGPPYPLCVCGHHRINHIGHGSPQMGGLEVRRNEGPCQKAVATSWCKCPAYREDVA